MSDTYHFTTVGGEEVKVKVGELRAIEHTIDHLSRNVVIIHLNTTGHEYMLDGNDWTVLRSVQNLVDHQTGHNT